MSEQRTTLWPTVASHGRSRCGTLWTDAAVAYGLDRFHRRYLRTPTLREVRAGLDDLPSYSTIKRIYGTLGNMLRHHGYLERKAGGQRGRRVVPRRGVDGRFIPGPSTPDNPST